MRRRAPEYAYLLSDFVCPGARSRHDRFARREIAIARRVEVADCMRSLVILGARMLRPPFILMQASRFCLLAIA